MQQNLKCLNVKCEFSVCLEWLCYRPKQILGASCTKNGITKWALHGEQFLWLVWIAIDAALDGKTKLLSLIIQLKIYCDFLDYILYVYVENCVYSVSYLDFWFLVDFIC